MEALVHASAGWVALALGALAVLAVAVGAVDIVDTTVDTTAAQGLDEPERLAAVAGIPTILKIFLGRDLGRERERELSA